MTTSRFQLVGSLLRPANLGEFKRQIEAREDIKYPFYDDLMVTKKLKLHSSKNCCRTKENGLDIVTDGEFGRSMWHLDFLWGFDGIERYIAEHGYPFKDHDGQIFETRKDIGLRITAPLSAKITISLIFSNK